MTSRLDSEIVKKVLSNLELSDYLRQTITSSINDCTAVTQLLKEVKSLRDANARLTNKVEELQVEVSRLRTESTTTLSAPKITVSETSYSSAVTNSLSNGTSHVKAGKVAAQNKKKDKKVLEENENGFTVVNRKKRSKLPEVIGTNKNETMLQSAPKKAWFFLGRLHPETTPEDITLYVKKKLGSEDILCTKISQEGANAAFKIGTKFCAKEKLETPEFWPAGVVIRKYNFFRKFNTQENNKNFHINRALTSKT